MFGYESSKKFIRPCVLPSSAYIEYKSVYFDISSPQGSICQGVEAL